jgi:hypothetical protein
LLIRLSSATGAGETAVGVGVGVGVALGPVVGGTGLLSGTPVVEAALPLAESGVGASTIQAGRVDVTPGDTRVVECDVGSRVSDGVGPNEGAGGNVRSASGGAVSVDVEGAAAAALRAGWMPKMPGE